jgi:hypothetical protein
MEGGRQFLRPFAKGGLQSFSLWSRMIAPSRITAVAREPSHECGQGHIVLDPVRFFKLRLMDGLPSIPSGRTHFGRLGVIC